jgi:ATP phosphoribosyltransferase
MSNGKTGADGARNGTSNNLLFAIPKKGRLNEKCMQLLAGAGLDHKRPERVDVAHCNNIPVRGKISHIRVACIVQRKRIG